ncbi:hypothetical protein MVEN_00264700 [Mycena venus]|uniref:Nucleoporin protein Ndc1-Nup n=1 Tax=Mycena venus TaxID=2733690 RepID=A0A8H6Z2X7_9AGAR|nr:hypothetical protein MVEN_00264700 [Mycena venus]
MLLERKSRKGKPTNTHKHSSSSRLPRRVKMASSTPRVAGVPTPIRAITTPLRSSAAPPIPPASQLYEPLAKAVLRRRLTNRIFPYTFLVALAGAVLSFFWVGRLALTRVMGVGVGMWLGGVLPVILLRKAYLTVTHTSAPSPLLLLQKSFAPPLRTRTKHALQAHVLSALVVLALHVGVVDPGVPVFIRSRKHPYTPHPVFVLLALSQIILAGVYVLRALLRDVWVFPFRRPTLTPSASGIFAPLLLAGFAPFAALVILFVVVPILRWIPLVSTLLRPILRPHLSVLRFFPRAAALGALTGWVWESAAGVWGWGVGEAVHTTPAMRALVSGISVAVTPAPVPAHSGSAFTSAASSAFSTPASSSFVARSSTFLAPPPAPAPIPPVPPMSIYTHLAYTELLAFSSSSEPGAAKARAEAFDVDGAVWGRLAREALVLIGREYQVLLARGAALTPASKPVAASTAAALTPAPSTADTPAVTPSPLLKKNIFAPKGPPSPAEAHSRASSSPPSPPLTAIPKAVPLPKKLVDAVPVPRVPEVQWQWRPLLQAVIPLVPMPEWVKRVAEGAMRVGEMGVPRAWSMKRKGREAAGWVPRREVCVEAIGVLTHLTCASLTEDRFGVVQRDIPRILEALLAFLAAVEDAQAALRPPVKEMPEAEKEVIELLEKVDEAVERKEQKEKRERAMERRRVAAEEAAHLEEARTVLGEVGDALKDGVARIVRTFGDKLRAFRFPPRTAARLQGFLEYHG